MIICTVSGNIVCMWLSKQDTILGLYWGLLVMILPLSSLSDRKPGHVYEAVEPALFSPVGSDSFSSFSHLVWYVLGRTEHSHHTCVRTKTTTLRPVRGSGLSVVTSAFWSFCTLHVWMQMSKVSSCKQLAWKWINVWPGQWNTLPSSYLCRRDLLLDLSTRVCFLAPSPDTFSLWLLVTHFNALRYFLFEKKQNQGENASSLLTHSPILTRANKRKVWKVSLTWA